jgi:predicted GNAT superfamily acetyltransferase
VGGEVFGRELVTLDELQQAEALLTEIWGATVFTADLLRALVMTGNYVAGLWRGGELLGASAGILGRDDDGLPSIRSSPGCGPVNSRRAPASR